MKVKIVPVFYLRGPGGELIIREQPKRLQGFVQSLIIIQNYLKWITPRISSSTDSRMSGHYLRNMGLSYVASGRTRAKNRTLHIFLPTLVCHKVVKSFSFVLT